MNRVWPLLVLMVLLGGKPTPAFAQLKAEEKSSVSVPFAVISQSSKIPAVLLTPDGKTLVAASGKTGHVVFVDVATGKEGARFLAHPGEIRCTTLSPDGTTLVTGFEKIIKVWDVKTRKQLLVLRSDERPSSLAFSPDGKALASMHGRLEYHAYWDPEIRIWDLTTGRERAQLTPELTPEGNRIIFQGGAFGLSKLAFSPDGRRLIAQWPGGDISLWEMETEQPLGLNQGIRSSNFVFSPDSKLIAMNDRLGKFRLWDAETGKEKASPAVRGILAFSPDGRGVAHTAGGLELFAIDSDKTQSLATLEKDKMSLNLQIFFSKDGKTLTALGYPLTGSNYWTLKTWELSWGKAPVK